MSIKSFWHLVKDAAKMPLTGIEFLLLIAIVVHIVMYIVN